MIRLLALIADLGIYLESSDGIHKCDQIGRECHKQIGRFGDSKIGKELELIQEEIKKIHDFLKDQNYTSAKEVYAEVNAEIGKIAEINKEEFRVLEHRNS